MTIQDQQSFWNSQAESFDDWPDHGLRDSTVQRAWSDLLTSLLPDGPMRVADLGCGTGSMSVLLAAHGHEVTGVDFAPTMLEKAETKARERGLSVEFHLGDAASPPLSAGTFDVVFARHVVWALPDQRGSLRRWLELLDSKTGRLVLIEGYWWTDAGLTATMLRGLLEPYARVLETRQLTDPRLWGNEIDDDRYVMVAEPIDRNVQDRDRAQFGPGQGV